MSKVNAERLSEPRRRRACQVGNWFQRFALNHTKYARKNVFGANMGKTKNPALNFSPFDQKSL